jgi:hypothetical protein
MEKPTCFDPSLYAYDMYGEYSSNNYEPEPEDELYPDDTKMVVQHIHSRED